MAARPPLKAVKSRKSPAPARAPTGTANVQKKADILIAVGATGSGKSTRIKADIDMRRLPRLMVWDAMLEYDDGSYVTCTTIRQLIDAVKVPGPFRVRFTPSFDPAVRKQQFDLFCRAAIAAKNCALLCEELSQVTNANGGGAGWTQVLTAGRHAGLIVYGTSQRPALIDKTAISQATRLYCGNLELPTDVKVMAAMLGQQESDIQALGPWDYIERNRETKACTTGNLADGPPK